MTPQRIQRKRERGWRMPPGAVYVGRPTKWGNPYGVGFVVSRPGFECATFPVDDRAHAVHLYERWLRGDALVPRSGYNLYREPPTIDQIRSELQGKDLVCWCPDEPCHASVLLRVAAGGAP